ncbi:MAG: DNA primase [Verrucomicrobiae bacterium]|nr:DNA primase [Verrucomicrobiae bacterium]
MGQIPRETIERILDETDILEVVSAYFPLKRAGSRFVALCPFHNEKSPSFGVNTQRQIFHCFGCGAGGDAIRFVMQYENLPFPEAAKKLADRAGIPIVEQVFDAKEEAGRQFRREIQTLQRKATEWYHRLLLKSPQAQPARDYLKGRGFGIELAKRWQLGYAPEQSGMFMDWARQEDISLRHLVEGGLAQWDNPDRPGGRAYARFRHRLMFPIANDVGDVIAFSGRVLSSDQKGGKYVNSPETVLFNKSKTFFGLDKSKRAIVRENRAIVVEGQIDMISVFEAGIDNVVAGQGTALTEQHAKILKRQVGESGEVVLCYDSDAAGYNAMKKGFRALASEGLLVRVIMLPPGEDPDSLIRKSGPEALKKIVAEAPEFFDFEIDRNSRTRNLDSLRDRLAFVRELAENIALVDDKMLQDSLIIRVTTRLGVGEAEVRALVAEAKSAALRTERSQNRRDAAEQRRTSGNPQSPQASGQSVPGETQQGQVPDLTLSNRSVRMLCQLLLTDPATRERLTHQPPPEFLRDLPETEFLTRIWQADFDPSSNSSVASFMSGLSQPEQDAVARLRSEAMPTIEVGAAEDCLRSLHRKALQNRIRGVKARLNDSKLSPAQMEALTKELLDLTKRLNDIPPLPSEGQ